jgi:hypothetical protein
MRALSAEKPPRRTPSEYSHLPHVPCYQRIISDSERRLVVLLLKVTRVLRHLLLHIEEEGQTVDLPPRLSPLHHVFVVVDRHQMGSQRIK